MSTSGTYNFSLSNGEIVLQAFARLGMASWPQIAQAHLQVAQNELNLLFIEWANRGPNLWTVDSQSITLVQGTTSYAVDPATIMILDARITQNGIDRTMTAISRSDYNDYPNKAQQAPPTTFWFDRLVAPTVTLWPVPDQSGYTFNYYRYRQSQDAALASVQGPEVQFRFIDALIWGLAERLCFCFAMDKLQMVAARSAAAYDFAAAQDTENAPMKVDLDFSGYYM